MSKMLIEVVKSWGTSRRQIIKAIEKRIIRNIRNPLEHGDKDYHKPVIVSSFYSDNYIKYENNGDRNKTLSIKKYFDKIRPHLKDVIDNLKKSDTRKIQLAVAINSIF